MSERFYLRIALSGVFNLLEIIIIICHLALIKRIDKPLDKNKQKSISGDLLQRSKYIVSQQPISQQELNKNSS